MRASPDSSVLSEYTVGRVKRIDLSKLSEKTVLFSHIYKLDVDANAFHKWELVITTTVLCCVQDTWTQHVNLVDDFKTMTCCKCLKPKVKCTKLNLKKTIVRQHKQRVQRWQDLSYKYGWQEGLGHINQQVSEDYRFGWENMRVAIRELLKTTIYFTGLNEGLSRLCSYLPAPLPSFITAL